MQRRTFLVTSLVILFAFSLLTTETDAYSDGTGVYARVDKVLLEPSASAPERIQIWGAFALATKQDRNSYDAAQRGYLYFSCKPGKEEVCRKEWADLKAVAGTGQIVGFGGRSQPRPRLRKAEDKPSDPDEYPVNVGLWKVSEMRSAYPPIPELKALPREKN
jgi:hypothetical protein